MLGRLLTKVRAAFPGQHAPRPIQSSNPFATHLPILVGLGSMIPFRRVLELGGGLYSTPAFLDRSVFPALEALDTYENDEDWATQLQARFRDERHRVLLHAGEMRFALPGIRFSDYDLVFVDDSKSYAERARTITELTTRYAHRNLIVIHDFEAPEYVAAARGFPRTFCVSTYLPHTGIAWADGRLDVRRLKALARAVGRHAKDVQPDDVSEWRRIFEATPCFR